ncbi:MAG: hypothetical protein RLZZ156_2449 [Deinococcota bacterium]|jgi:hypothetical protein
MKPETWLYKQTLELYPRAYREQFGEPMLETYTDALNAAKLEGGAFEFHKLTIVDSVKGIFRATAEIEKPDVLARVGAILAIIYALYYLLINPLLGVNPQFKLQLIFESIAPVFSVIGFIIAIRRSFSEWLYFALMSVFGTIKLVLDAYLGTYNWYFQKYQLPDFVYQLATIRGWVGWALFLTLFIFVVLRSKEQKRLSKLIWLFLIDTLVWVGYILVPAPQPLRTEFHFHDLLFWLATISGAVYFLVFALKF